MSLTCTACNVSEDYEYKANGNRSIDEEMLKISMASDSTASLDLWQEIK